MNTCSRKNTCLASADTNPLGNGVSLSNLCAGAAFHARYINPSTCSTTRICLAPADASATASLWCVTVFDRFCSASLLQVPHSMPATSTQAPAAQVAPAWPQQMPAPCMVSLGRLALGLATITRLQPRHLWTGQS
jgi:hypothetical protein